MLQATQSIPGMILNTLKSILFAVGRKIGKWLVSLILFLTIRRFLPRPVQAIGVSLAKRYGDDVLRFARPYAERALEIASVNLDRLQDRVRDWRTGNRMQPIKVDIPVRTNQRGNS